MSATESAEPLVLAPGDALLVVDIQHDFLPGGALGVAGGDAVIAPLNAAIDRFVAAGLPVLASRDWHPPDHCSFQPQGGRWPVHCVRDTRGAAFSAALRLPAAARIISKATEPDREAYSAFAGTPLESALRETGVRRLFIGGLATEYCVLQSVLDARRLGFDVVVLVDGICAIDRVDGDCALQSMWRACAAAARAMDLAA